MEEQETLTGQGKVKWGSFGLDARLIRAIGQLKWGHPTPVQATAIPLALRGKDILAKAKTGSGKTGAYAVPIIQQLLAERMGKTQNFGTKALVLVPTTELAGQVHLVFEDLCKYCPQIITIYSVTSDQPLASQAPRLAEFPDILVATPARLLAHVEAKNIDLTTSLKVVVVDEADLVMSFGYKEDLKKIRQFIPKIVQGFLMSATLSSEVTDLKQIMLHTPAVLQLKEVREENQLKQFYVNCKEEDKLLLLYVALKLKLIAGKTMIFVNDILSCYRLKLFLERFSIKAAVLNSELPHNSRYHIIQQLNRGIIEIVIATDEKKKPGGIKALLKKPQRYESDDSEEGEPSEEFVMSDEEALDDSEEDDNVEDDIPNDEIMDDDDDEEEERLAMAEMEGMADDESDETKSSKNEQSQEQNDQEYGVARGIDFKTIANIINFDFPETKEDYVHRVGRTARAGAAGLAFSFISEKDGPSLEIVLEQQQSLGHTITPYVFQVAIVEGFRYRVLDVSRSVTKRAIQEARLAEIKREILTSKKLKSHFEENPSDLQSLQHDKDLQSNKIQRHLAFVPDYLMPSKKELSQTLTPAALAEKLQDEKMRVAYSVRSLKQRKRDPLKSFERSGGMKRGRDAFNNGEGGHPSKRFKRKTKKAPARKITGKKFKPTGKKPF